MPDLDFNNTFKYYTHTEMFSTVKPFLFGGIAGMTATSIIQPADTVKVRAQLHGEGVSGAKGSTIQIIRNLITEGGVKAFYTGLSAALARQAVYGTARLGMYRSVSDTMMKDDRAAGGQSNSLPFWKKALVSLSTGGAAAILGNPCDLSLVRMQADGRLPVEARRNYTGILNALSRIIREEGVLTLWRGSAPTVYRAMVMNCGMLATYDQAKEVLQTRISNTRTVSIEASFISGFVSSTMVLPFDMIKTRIQQQTEVRYTSVMQACKLIVSQEGVAALYKGYTTFIMRMCPHVVISLLVLEELNKL